MKYPRGGFSENPLNVNIQYCISILLYWFPYLIILLFKFFFIVKLNFLFVFRERKKQHLTCILADPVKPGFSTNILNASTPMQGYQVQIGSATICIVFHFPVALLGPTYSTCIWS